MKKQSLLFLLFSLITVPVMHSQKKSDVSGWITTDLVLTQGHWDYTASLEYRSKENMGKMDLFSIGTYGRYTFSPLLKVSGGYEAFLTHTFDRGTIWEHRLLLQNESSFYFQGIKIDNRFSFLDDFEKINTPSWGIRDRLRLKYPVRNIEPYTYLELYYYVKTKQMVHHKNRYAVGLNYMIDSQHFLGMYYMREAYFQKIFANNVIGISYVMTLSI